MEARRLLQHAGYPNGFPLTFTIMADPEVVSLAEVIQDYLKAVGIRVSIRQLEWSAFKEAVAKGETDLFYLSWWADYPDPENFLYPLFHSSNWGAAGNRSRFRDPLTDRRLDEARSITDPQRRMDRYREIEDRIVDQSPWVFLWHKKDFSVHQSRIEGLRLYPIYSMDKGLEVRIDNDHNDRRSR
jgi:peptide/nickel transport system substrate-binding protein/oligopeptide transport system substrate-binding protein